jgi:hypothetical protein
MDNIIIEEFYQKITGWLLPLGYIETFTNHPLSSEREWHFIRNGVRVKCFKTESKEYCYLSYDMLTLPIPLTVITPKIAIEDKILHTIHQYLLDHVYIIEKNFRYNYGRIQ